MERNGLVTFKGNPMTLTGQPVAPGDRAPGFTAVDQSLKPVSLSEYTGKTLIISSVPSLDTSVCSLQTKRFEEEAARQEIPILTISMDLPFAQRRWCDENQAKHVHVVSDYKDREFGQAYGLYIKELGLLARAVTVIASDGTIAYQEIVPEMTNQPDYDALHAATEHLRV